jgi:hypothetical protein
MSLQLAEAELPCERKALAADLDGLVAPAGEHEEAGRLGVRLRLRGRRRPVADELTRVLEARERGIAAPREPIGLGKQHLRLDGVLDIPGREEAVAGALGERLVAVLPNRQVGAREPQDEQRPLGILLRPEVERLREEVQRRGQRAERERTLAGAAEREPRALLERRRFLARRTRELERGLEVVGEHLRPVLGAIGSE